MEEEGCAVERREREPEAEEADGFLLLLLSSPSPLLSPHSRKQQPMEAFIDSGTFLFPSPH